MMKLWCVIVFCLLIVQVISSDQVKNDDGDKPKAEKVSKRGVNHFGTGFLPANYASYFGYQTPLATASHLTIPSSIPPSAPYILGHGGAVVSSYNVNYPRYPYFSPKPYTAFNPGLFGNFVLPSSTAGTSIIPPNPILPLPIHPIFPSPSVIPARPILPTNTVVASNFLIPSQTLGPAVAPKPIALPTPGFVPLGFTQNFVPFAVSGSTPSASGNHHAALAPGQSWRPILVQSPSPAPSASIPRPAINLLPPYQAQKPEKGNLEDFKVPAPGQGYLVPSIQQRIAELELLRQQHQELRQSQQQQQQQQQQQFLDAQEISGRAIGNGDKYAGVSSYDVPLEGNKGYSY